MSKNIKKEKLKKKDKRKQMPTEEKEWFGENHMRGYNFCGGGTKVMERFSGTYKGKVGTNYYWLPRDIVDMVCIKHDLRYYDESTENKLMADYFMTCELKTLFDKHPKAKTNERLKKRLSDANGLMEGKLLATILWTAVVGGFGTASFKDLSQYLWTDLIARTPMANMFNDPSKTNVNRRKRRIFNQELENLERMNEETDEQYENRKEKMDRFRKALQKRTGTFPEFDWADWAQQRLLTRVITNVGRRLGYRQRLTGGASTPTQSRFAYNPNRPLLGQRDNLMSSLWFWLKFGGRGITEGGVVYYAIGELLRQVKDVLQPLFAGHRMDRTEAIEKYEEYLKRVGKFDDNGDFALLDNIDHEEAENKYEEFFNTFNNTVKVSNKKQGVNEEIIPLTNPSQFGFEGITPTLMIKEGGIEETSTTTTPPPSATGTIKEWFDYIKNATSGDLMKEMPNITKEVLPFVEEPNLNFTLKFTENKTDVPLPPAVNNYVPSNLESVNETNITEIVEGTTPPQEEGDETEGKELAIRDKDREEPPPIQIGMDKVEDEPNGLVLPIPLNIVQGDDLMSSEDKALVLYKYFGERGYDIVKKKWKYQNATPAEQRRILWTAIKRIKNAKNKRDAKALVLYNKTIATEKMYTAYKKATTTKAPLDTTSLPKEVREAVDALQEEDDRKEVEVVSKASVPLIEQITNYFKGIFSGGTSDETEQITDESEAPAKNKIEIDNIMNETKGSSFTGVPVSAPEENNSSKKPVFKEDLTLKANAPTCRPMFPNITEENLDTLDILDSVDEHMRNLRNADIFDIPTDQTGGNGTAKTNDLIRMNEIQFNLSHAGKLSDERNAFNYPWDDAFYKPVPIVDEKQAVAELNTEDFLNNNNAILDYLEKYDRGDNGFMPSIQTKEEQKIDRNIYMPSANYYEPTPYSKFDNTVNQGMLRTDFEKNVNYFLVP